MNKNFPGFDAERIAAYFKAGEEWSQTAMRIAQASYETADPKKMWENQKRNLQALTEANRLTAKSFEEIFRSQVEIIKSVTEQARKDFEKLHSETNQPQDFNAQSKIVQKAIENATNELLQLVETAAKTHSETFAAWQEAGKGFQAAKSTEAKDGKKQAGGNPD